MSFVFHSHSPFASTFRSHRNTVLTTNMNREATSSIFTELSGMINSNPAPTLPSHHACNNRLNAVPSNQGNYHNNSNNSPTQVSSSLSVVPPTSIHASSPASTTTQTSQHRQSKSQLLINHKNSANDFGHSDMNLHATKLIQATTTDHLNYITNSVDENSSHAQNNHDNGMVTIVTVNSLSGYSGNSIV